MWGKYGKIFFCFIQIRLRSNPSSMLILITYIESHKYVYFSSVQEINFIHPKILFSDKIYITRIRYIEIHEYIFSINQEINFMQSEKFCCPIKLKISIAKYFRIHCMKKLVSVSLHSSMTGPKESFRNRSICFNMCMVVCFVNSWVSSGYAWKKINGLVHFIKI